MKFLAILLVLCAAANICLAIKKTTACPVKEVISNFNFENYLGKWFELQKYSFEREQSYRCVTAEYTLKNATTFYFKHEYLDNNNEHKAAGNSDKPNIGYLSYPDEQPLRGILSLVYRAKGAPKPNYFILDTDYTNYAVVWGCRTLPTTPKTEFKSDELAFVLSRTPNPTEDVQKLIDASVEKYLEVSSLKVTNQDAKLCGY